MFSFEDNRTAEERKRDLNADDKRRAEDELALGFLKTFVRPLLAGVEGVSVGLAGKDWISGAQILVEVDGVTYQLSAKVDHDG